MASLLSNIGITYSSSIFAGGGMNNNEEPKEWPVELGAPMLAGDYKLEPEGVIEYKDGKLGDLEPHKAYLIPMKPKNKCEICDQPFTKLHSYKGCKVCDVCLEGDS